MAKILTVLVLAAGIADIATAIKGANPEDLAADILELATEKADALAKAEAAQKELDDAVALNDKHVKAIEKLSKKAPKEDKPTEPVKPEFEVDGVTWGFKLQSCYFKGVLITTDEVCADKELQAKLIKIGSGMIYKK